LNDLKLYFRYLGVSLRGQMQYRASFWMMASGQLLTTAIEFLGIWVLFQRFGNLKGWSLAEVALLYGIVNLAFALAEGIGRGWDVFPALVRAGEFDRLLLRPRGTALQVAGLEMQAMRIGRLLQGLAILVWAVLQAGVGWSLAKTALVLACVVGGACLFYGLFVLQATAAFWTVEALELANTVTYGGTETAQYPLTIYRPWFRRFFTFVVPLACVNYLPAHLLLGRPSEVPALLLWAAPGVGVLFLLVALQAWKVGVRHYRSTGS